jgi:hypothetical protein
MTDTFKKKPRRARGFYATIDPEIRPQPPSRWPTPTPRAAAAGKPAPAISGKNHLKTRRGSARPSVGSPTINNLGNRLSLGEENGLAEYLHERTDLVHGCGRSNCPRPRLLRPGGAVKHSLCETGFCMHTWRAPAKIRAAKAAGARLPPAQGVVYGTSLQATHHE